MTTKSKRVDRAALLPLCSVLAVPSVLARVAGRPLLFRPSSTTATTKTTYTSRSVLVHSAGGQRPPLSSRTVHVEDQSSHTPRRRRTRIRSAGGGQRGGLRVTFEDDVTSLDSRQISVDGESLTTSERDSGQEEAMDSPTPVTPSRSSYSELTVENKIYDVPRHPPQLSASPGQLMEEIKRLRQRNNSMMERFNRILTSQVQSLQLNDASQDTVPVSDKSPSRNQNSQENGNINPVKNNEVPVEVKEDSAGSDEMESLMNYIDVVLEENRSLKRRVERSENDPPCNNTEKAVVTQPQPASTCSRCECHSLQQKQQQQQQQQQHLEHLEQLCHISETQECVENEFHRIFAELKASYTTENCELSGKLSRAEHANRQMQDRLDEASSSIDTLHARMRATLKANLRLKRRVEQLKKQLSSCRALKWEAGSYLTEMLSATTELLDEQAAFRPSQLVCHSDQEHTSPRHIRVKKHKKSLRKVCPK